MLLKIKIFHCSNDSKLTHNCRLQTWNTTTTTNNTFFGLITTQTDRQQTDSRQTDRRGLGLTCLRVLATRLSSTGPRSSCRRWTSSRIRRRTTWDRATSPTLFLVTTSHFSGVVTNILRENTQHWFRNIKCQFTFEYNLWCQSIKHSGLLTHALRDKKTPGMSIQSVA